MIYREFRGEKLSALGFGSMRMPVVDGDYGKVDYKAAEEMVDCAMRGGKLCSLSAEDEAKLKALRPQESVTGWGFRFVQSVPEVVVTLSGMSTLAQVQENIKTFETDAPLGAGELEALFGIAREMTGRRPFPARRAATARATARKSWIFPSSSNCTTSIALRAAGSSRRWR